MLNSGFSLAKGTGRELTLPAQGTQGPGTNTRIIHTPRFGATKGKAGPGSLSQLTPLTGFAG